MQLTALIIFFLLILVEIIIFLVFDNNKVIDRSKSIKIINNTAFLTKLIHIVIGFFNFFIFLLISIFYSLFLYFLWLKFRYFNEYDKLQRLNFYSLILFSFFNYFMLFFDRFYAPDIITFNILILSLSIGFFPYISYKKKAIYFRDEAIEAFYHNNYEEGFKSLSKGILNAQKMLIRFNFLPERPLLQSKLGKMMELEYNNLKLSNLNDLDLNQIFKTPKITKYDSRKYFLFLIIPFLLLFLPLYLFRI